MDNQPTNFELATALRIAKVFAQTPQSGQAKGDLERIRNRRTTWVGTEDLDLRKKIDTYISGNGGGF